MGTFLQDLRYGARMLWKKPVLTAITVLTLALGIGANSAIFSVVNAVLVRPLPFPDADRLIMVEPRNNSNGETGGVLSPPDFKDLRERNSTFQQLAAFQSITMTLTGDGSDSERVLTGRVSSGFFEAFGIQPLNGGRVFSPDEEKEGANGVVILSHSLWQQRYGADPEIVGKTINLNGQATTVVGVMPESFQYPREAKMWVPMSLYSQQMSVRRYHNVQSIGRLKPGVTVAEAQADMSNIASQLEQAYPESNKGAGIGLTPLPEWTVGNIRSTLLVLMAAVGFVLLIACANVANLSLAGGASRSREIAVRVALGASRGRVVRQLLTESLLAALLGGVVGMLLAMWGIDLLISLSPRNLPRMDEISTDWHVVGFTLVISVITGVVFGLAPALVASKTELTETLKEGGRGTSGSSRSRLRNGLVISEVALSLILLTGAGLLIKSFVRLSSVDPGFKPTNVLTMQVALARPRYPEPKQRAQFFNQLTHNLEAVPGIAAAGAVSQLPLSGQESDTFFNVAGRAPVPFGSIQNDANIRTITPDYFKAIGVPLVRGRMLADSDTLDAAKVVVVNERFVQQFFPNEEPLGHHITIDRDVPFEAEIIGVVGSIRHSSLAQRQPSAEMYISSEQLPPFTMSLVVRGTGDPAPLTAVIRREIQALDKDIPLYDVKSMEQRISESASQSRFRTLLLGIFAGVALLLAGIGIYGVISYSVTQRTHEIGLRMALGARTTDVLSMIVRQGMLVAVVGVVLGIGGAFAATRVLGSFLFNVSATDPLTFASVSIVLLGIAFLACFLPARRAARVDPMVALRNE